jgi:hypothetical protein
MNTLVTGIVAAFVGGVLAAAAVFTLVGVTEGPSPSEVAAERQVGVDAGDLAYGSR